MNESLEAKLIGLGFPKDGIQEDVEIFTKVLTPRDLEEELRERRYTCDVEQYLCPRFRVLYNSNQEVRERVGKELGSLGIPLQVANDYFTDFGNQPYMILHFTHEEIPLDVREKFIGKAEEVMLQLVREHLGVARLKQS